MKNLHRRPMTFEEAKASLLDTLRDAAAAYKANNADHTAAYRLDKAEDMLVQRFGMTYDEVHKVITKC